VLSVVIPVAMAADRFNFAMRVIAANSVSISSIVTGVPWAGGGIGAALARYQSHAAARPEATLNIPQASSSNSKYKPNPSQKAELGTCGGFDNDSQSAGGLQCTKPNLRELMRGSEQRIRCVAEMLQKLQSRGRGCGW
jgi:hypothetical protein